MDPQQLHFAYSPGHHAGTDQLTHHHQIDASMQQPAWPAHTPQLPQTMSPAAQMPQMYPVPNHDYPSPTVSTVSSGSPTYLRQSSGEFTGQQHSPIATPHGHGDTIMSNYGQLESSIGPSRVLTRRQRAALEQGTLSTLR